MLYYLETMVGGLKAEKLLGGNTIEDTQAMIKAKEAEAADKSAGTIYTTNAITYKLYFQFK